MPTITINLTNEQATRLQVAWEAQFRVAPTMTDVRQRLVDDLKSIVWHGERKLTVRQAKADIVAPAPPFDPT